MNHASQRRKPAGRREDGAATRLQILEAAGKVFAEKGVGHATGKEIAERAGTMASMVDQKVLGVVENMAYLDAECPHCGQSHRVDLFGSGGGSRVARGATASPGGAP